MCPVYNKYNKYLLNGQSEWGKILKRPKKYSTALYKER